MKTIVDKIPESSLVDFHSLPERPVIGFRFGVPRRVKGWFQCAQFGTNNYQLLSINNGVSNANGWAKGNNIFNSLREAWDFLTIGTESYTTKEIFLFKDERELFEWLSKD